MHAAPYFYDFLLYHPNIAVKCSFLYIVHNRELIDSQLKNNINTPETSFFWQKVVLWLTEKQFWGNFLCVTVLRTIVSYLQNPKYNKCTRQ